MARKRTRAQRTEDRKNHTLEAELPMGDVASSWDALRRQFLLRPPFTDAVDVDFMMRYGMAFYTAHEGWTRLDR